MAIKLQVSKENLLLGLHRVQNVISARSTLPILNNVLLTAEKNSLALTTTDLEVGIRTTVEATVSKTGASTVPCRKLLAVIREATASDVEIDVDDRDAAVVRYGSSVFKLLGLPEGEFPRFPSITGGVEFTLEQAALAKLLDRTSYAASTEESRYVLNGVYFSVKSEKVTAVATDGRRLALAEEECQTSVTKEVGFILPTKAVSELMRLLQPSGNVKAAFSDTQISFNMGHTVLVSKLIDGEFPNYRQVIPTESKERVKLERELFLKALHRVSLLSQDKPTAVRLSFSKNQLSLASFDPEVGEAKETLSIQYKGKDFTIGFNPHYLMDPLRHLDSDMITFDLTDDISPGVIKVEEPFIYVLMPMRLN
ncbi:MAG: DNA polymerase III subunit beta [Verrucomicrobiae bacterium]|nr:DNA polymerase III subunit beta [Verrucomicrobiae bacterium]